MGIANFSAALQALKPGETVPLHLAAPIPFYIDLREAAAEELRELAANAAARNQSITAMASGTGAIASVREMLEQEKWDRFNQVFNFMQRAYNDRATAIMRDGVAFRLYTSSGMHTLVLPNLAVESVASLRPANAPAPPDDVNVALQNGLAALDNFARQTVVVSVDLTKCTDLAQALRASLALRDSLSLVIGAVSEAIRNVIERGEGQVEILPALSPAFVNGLKPLDLGAGDRALTAAQKTEQIEALLALVKGAATSNQVKDQGILSLMEGRSSAPPSGVLMRLGEVAAGGGPGSLHARGLINVANFFGAQQDASSPPDTSDIALAFRTLSPALGALALGLPLNIANYNGSILIFAGRNPTTFLRNLKPNEKIPSENEGGPVVVLNAMNRQQMTNFARKQAVEDAMKDVSAAEARQMTGLPANVLPTPAQKAWATGIASIRTLLRATAPLSSDIPGAPLPGHLGRFGSK